MQYACARLLGAVYSFVVLPVSVQLVSSHFVTCECCGMAADSVCCAPLQRIDEGRFTKEAFKEDGAPEGYFDTAPSDGDY